MHTFYSNRRDYNDWYTIPQIEKKIDPLKLKLFSKDRFEIIDNNDNVVKLLSSPVRDYDYHAGVLILHSNRTYGKAKNGRMLYKCIPNDKTMPIFLIPYDLHIGFIKDHTNKYVLFSFRNWDGKHPIGVIRETFGNVDNYSSFCSYQLWCSRLVYSIAKLNRNVKIYHNNNSEESLIQNILQNNEYNIEDKREENVFTIDPEGSKDLDDGISITVLPDGDFKISIYIANVYIMLDQLELWDKLTDRVSTIYLPEDRRTLLPDLLSDDFCSLLENKDRISFCMEFIYSKQNNYILKDSIRFYNAIINVKNNYRYEQSELLNTNDYQNLYTVTKNINNDIIDSHDVVAHWMIYMNTTAAETLYKHKTGIFRVVSKKEDIVSSNDDQMRHKISLWNNVSGSYEKYVEDLNTKHDVLNVSSYLHVTSPIRRAVDIVNQIYFFKYMFKVELCEDCDKFVSRFEMRIPQLNDDVKAIRKVQSECDLLYACKNDETVLETHYEGYVFNKKYENNQFTYSVFLKKLNKISFFRSNDEIGEHEIRMFKLYLFDRENSGHRKIRLALI